MRQGAGDGMNKVDLRVEDDQPHQDEHAVRLHSHERHCRSRREKTCENSSAIQRGERQLTKPPPSATTSACISKPSLPTLHYMVLSFIFAVPPLHGNQNQVRVLLYLPLKQNILHCRKLQRKLCLLNKSWILWELKSNFQF